ncbi:hypothetical protein GOL21_30830 [Sinorhizobium medicae]|nr:hypothetical protein [Sinorhizobium medicae]
MFADFRPELLKNKKPEQFRDPEKSGCGSGRDSTRPGPAGTDWPFKQSQIVTGESRKHPCRLTGLTTWLIGQP